MRLATSQIGCYERGRIYDTDHLFQDLARRPPGDVQFRQAHLRVFPRQDQAVSAGFERDDPINALAETT